VIGFHSGICGLGVVDPLWRISDLWVNILKRDWEMDQVQVKIVKTEIFKSPFTGWLHVFGVMESVPKFRNDEKLFSLYDSLINRSFDALTSLFFIAVVAR
jgi:hypothetical protein